MFFTSLQKLVLFSRKLKTKILDIQISWCHQVPKHKTRNTFYRIIWEVIAVCKHKFDQIVPCNKKERFHKNILKKLQPENQFHILLCLVNLYWKMKFLKEATYVGYVIAKLSKFVQIRCRPPQTLFIEDFLTIKRKALKYFPGHIFHSIF